MLFVPIRYINNGEPLDQVTLNRYGFDVQENLEEIISRLGVVEGGGAGSVPEIPHTLALRDDNGTTQFAAPVVGTNPLRLMDSSKDPVPSKVVVWNQYGSISDDIGQCAVFGGTPNPNWVVADGRSISRAAYPALFQRIGTQYGSTDGSSFNVPDLRPLLETSSSSGGGSAFGNMRSFAASGVSSQSGIVMVVGAHNSYLIATVNGIEVQRIAHRSKYGQGPVSLSFAIKAGDSYSITGHRGITAIYILPIEIGLPEMVKIPINVNYYIKAA